MLEEDGTPININQLPSCARMCLNIICIPQEDSCKHIKKSLPVSGSAYSVVQGLVLGSVSISIFDEHFYMRQGKL
jgi:hypothetical protein